LRRGNSSVDRRVLTPAAMLVVLGGSVRPNALGVLSQELHEQWFLRLKERWAVVYARPA
jgi:hypothetical protein